MYTISIVLPAYNEEKMIERAVQVLNTLFEKEKMNGEILFVDDGSKDQTWIVIEKMAREQSNVVGIHFSRNFGKEAAIYAGLAHAKGDCVVVMDCDLQHPPEMIPQMYKLWQEGYECVEGVKRSRGREGLMHKLSANLFYKLISKAVGIDMSRASDFKLLDRKVVNALLNLPEQNAFFRALSSWVGFKYTQVEFDVREREAGESKWSTAALIKYAVTNITSFTTVPMQIVTMAGIVTCIFSGVLGVNTLVNYFSGRAVEGFTTVILVMLMIGSIIMLSLGIIGYYIAKIYDETKRRPKYIISKILGGK